MSDVTPTTGPVYLSSETTLALGDHLKACGWDPEYITDSEIKMTFPDPDTGHAMTRSEFWLSWRLTDGQLTYGISDDIGDPWRRQLNVAADSSPEVVAEAADRAMHLLWHCDERDNSSTVYAKNELLRAMELRIGELGRRLVVTPGMIRAALKPSRKWLP